MRDYYAEQHPRTPPLSHSATYVVVIVLLMAVFTFLTSAATSFNQILVIRFFAGLGRCRGLHLPGLLAAGDDLRQDQGRAGQGRRQLRKPAAGRGQGCRREDRQHDL